MKVKCISSNAKRGTAMVVIIQPNPMQKGKNQSETRHLKVSGGGWTDTHGNRFDENFKPVGS